MTTTLLRKQLQKLSLTGFIVPRTDEYQNEYIAPYAERLSRVSGFTGSAGLGLVLMDSAVLFVDGRYLLQAQNQVDKTQFIIDDFTDNSIATRLKKQIKPNDRIGYCPELHTKQSLKTFLKSSNELGFKLVAVSKNPIDQSWQDQPERPTSKVVEHPLCYVGLNSVLKCQNISAQIKDAGTCLLYTSPSPRD